MHKVGCVMWAAGWGGRLGAAYGSGDGLGQAVLTRVAIALMANS